MDFFCNLPAEIVDAIVGVLCLHCTPGDVRQCFIESRDCANPGPTEHSRVSALLSLCLTSRQLNSVATRHLYHRPLVRERWLLARTLVAREDLALLVRDWHTGNMPLAKELSCPPEVETYFADQYRSWVNRQPEDRALLACNSKDKYDRMIKRSSSFPLDILTSLCPNLETLHAYIGDYYVSMFFPPQSLLRLQNVALRRPYSEDYNIHRDLRDFIPLFRAAPNITKILFHDMRGCDELGLTLDKLTHLNIRDCAFDGVSLANILRACPNLETLEYDMGVYVFADFTPNEARDAIFRHCPNLKIFRLYICAVVYGDGNWDVDLEELEQTLMERGVRFEFRRCGVTCGGRST
ncbi:hypothetical protein VTK56DRAFT_5817 [Thermocarpiscus australiensis]